MVLRVEVSGLILFDAIISSPNSSASIKLEKRGRERRDLGFRKCQTLAFLFVLFCDVLFFYKY